MLINVKRITAQKPKQKKFHYLSGIDRVRDGSYVLLKNAGANSFGQMQYLDATSSALRHRCAIEMAPAYFHAAWRRDSGVGNFPENKAEKMLGFGLIRSGS